MKRAVRNGIVFGCLLVVAYVVGTSFQDARASSRTKLICESISPGFTKDQLVNLVSEKEGKLRIYEPDMAVAGVTGWGITCKCRIELKNNVVTNVGNPLCLS